MSRAFVAFEPYAHAEGVWAYLEERFGMARFDLAGFRLWQRGEGKTVWILPSGIDVPGDLKIEWAGLPVLRQPLPRGFPTNAFVRRFGDRATRNVFDVDWETALRLMYSHQIEAEALDPKGGPYVVRSPLGPLGRGWVRKGRLLLDIPKGWSAQLLPRTDLAEVASGTG